MSEEDGGSAGGIFAREILRIATRIWDSRAVARRELMSKRIEPMFQAMYESHEDFLHCLDQIEKAYADIEIFFQWKLNNTNDIANTARGRIEVATDIRSKKRAQRRITFEKAFSFTDRLSDDAIKEKIVFSEREKGYILKFYTSIMSYLSFEEGEYRHDLKNYIRIAMRDIYKFEYGTLSYDDFAVSLDGLRKYIGERESRWSDISRAYSYVLSALE